MGMVMRLADAVTVLDFGRRIADGAPGRRPERPGGRRAYLGRRSAQPHEHLRRAPRSTASPWARVYALIALGFVVIFKATEVVNFAHASLLLAGGYVTAVLHDDIGFWPALLAGIAGAALVGAAVEFLVMRRTGAPTTASWPSSPSASTSCSTTELTRRIGTDVLALGDPWGDAVAHLGPVTIAADPDRRVRRRGPAHHGVPARLPVHLAGAWRCARPPRTRRPPR